MLRDPHVKREDGLPECFGNYEEGHYVCDSQCDRFLSCKNEKEEELSRAEGKTFKGPDGRPSCFSKLYGPFSDECNMFCNVALECAEAVENNEKLKKMWSASSSGVRSDSLKMYQTQPSYQQPSYQQQPYYRPPQQQPVSIFNQPTPTIYNYPVDDRTNAYMKAKYGVPLKIDPTVPGQFEGEQWYERFFKEVLKYAGYYALKLLADITIGARWAPIVEEKKDE